MTGFHHIFRIRLHNEGNSRDAWPKRYRRKKAQRKIITITWKKLNPSITLPCIITLTKLSPREWDDDNMIYSFKSIRDAIADLIIPGKMPGQADGDKRITWKYAQKKSKIYGIELNIDPL